MYIWWLPINNIRHSYAESAPKPLKRAQATVFVLPFLGGGQDAPGSWTLQPKTPALVLKGVSRRILALACARRHASHRDHGTESPRRSLQGTRQNSSRSLVCATPLLLQPFKGICKCQRPDEHDHMKESLILTRVGCANVGIQITKRGILIQGPL